jgi:hypothetical protein
VVSQYAGTIFQASYSGTRAATGTVTPLGNGAAVAMNGSAQGEAVGSATPTYRYTRQTQFSARLLELSSGKPCGWRTVRLTVEAVEDC